MGGLSEDRSSFVLAGTARHTQATCRAEKYFFPSFLSLLLFHLLTCFLFPWSSGSFQVETFPKRRLSVRGLETKTEGWGRWGCRTGAIQDCRHDFLSHSPKSGFQNNTSIPEITKGTFNSLCGCLTINSWRVTSCFELKQTHTEPQV